MIAAPKTSFPPVLGENTRVLILGSLPGEKSLQLGQYYANSRNQFWKLLSEVTTRPFPDAYEGRRSILRDAGIGVWDVVKSARRVGSLDANIRDHQANPLTALVEQMPGLQAIAFNGRTASKIGQPQLRECVGVRLITLPSSSPALPISFERKLGNWLQLRPHPSL